MSASLVGSEMCIRDSGRAARSRDVACAKLPGGRGRCRKAAGRHGRRPVSYTHLTLPTICSV
eukprot:10309981-Alexandrium_andersonii.AAC.1